MDFYAVLDQVVALLRSRGRVSYRALRVQLHLDDEAIEALKGAIAIDPEYAFVYIQLAHAYEKSGQIELARQTIEVGRGPAARNGDPNLMRQLDEIAARLPR